MYKKDCFGSEKSRENNKEAKWQSTGRARKDAEFTEPAELTESSGGEKNSGRKKQMIRARY